MRSQLTIFPSLFFVIYYFNNLDFSIYNLAYIGTDMSEMNYVDQIDFIIGTSFTTTILRCRRQRHIFQVEVG